MADKKMKVTYFVQKTEEVTVSIPDDAQIQALEIDGKAISLQGTNNINELAQVLSGFGMGAIKIAGNDIPIPAILQLINLIPGLMGKLGIELK